MALLLLCENADVNLTDVNGNTALHIAARNGLVKAVGELCGHGCDIDAANNVCWIFEFSTICSVLEDEVSLKNS